MNDIAFSSAGALAAALRRRAIGSRELLEHYIKRVERFNPDLNAVVSLDLEGARRRADALDAAAVRGEFQGPLHGLPITIKDLFETEGLRTTAGTKQYAEHVPTQNAVAVQRLVDAGAVVFGKTNTPAFGADVQTYNDLFGVTRNPWNLAHTSGGSSGGAAAAVAAGLTAFELGSDLGGSIRTPAHCCGIYGHKATFDVIPKRGSIPGPPGTLSTGDITVAGPLARSAEDLELTLSILAGPLPDRAIAWRLALPPPRRTRLADYRIAAWLDDPEFPIDRAVAATLRKTIDALRAAGARVDEKARPAFAMRDAVRTYFDLLWAAGSGGIPQQTFDRFREIAEKAAPEDTGVVARHARARTMRHREWLRANEARERYRAAWGAFFEKYDVLLMPVIQTPAIPHDHSADMLARTITVNGAPRWYWEQLAWIGIVGMAYLPATTAPIGFADGLPVGIQIAGPYLEDLTTIDFAKRLAEVVGGYQVPPGY
ncbi:MAG: amidase [Sulfurifustis sp.]